MAFWATVAVVVVLVIGYPASFGPAFWIASRTEDGPALVNFIYQPLMKAWWRGGVPRVRDLPQRYARLYADTRRSWYIGLDRDRDVYVWQGGSSVF